MYNLICELRMSRQTDDGKTKPMRRAKKALAQPGHVEKTALLKTGAHSPILARCFRFSMLQSNSHKERSHYGKISKRAAII